MNSLYSHSVSYPTDKTLIDLFSEQAIKTPNRVAVVSQNKSITYRALEEKTNQLAHYLRKRGVTTETLVPICLDRSLEMIIGLLGILKAGGAYVPIDPDYPQDRIDYVLTDTGGRVVVADGAASRLFTRQATTHEIVYIDRDAAVIAQEPITAPPSEVDPHNIAYVIYTSGSTGRPKGVMIEHRQVVRLFKTDAPLFDFTETDVWTLFHSFCFDFSVWEMYGALLNGGRLVIVSKAIARDASAFGDLLLSEGVTIVNQTPSAFYVLQDYLLSKVTSVPMRYVIFGGEALNPAKLQGWKQAYPNCRLINMYGITETTVHVTYQELTDAHVTSNSSIIGTAIPTLYTRMLDEAGQVVPLGAWGELYVGGAGLSRGYLNLPELTATRFINDPFGQPGERLYRTGDLARQLPDGQLEYGGRIDEQVKIRGFRIELGEIESILQQHPDVKQGVVVAKDDANGDKRLVGYIVPKGIYDKERIMQFLAEKLPDYMVPRLWLSVPAIPLTSNGKVDRKSLPNPDASTLVTSQYVAPTGKTETHVASVWKTILGVDKVGTKDNFFELGGNSLLAAKAVAMLKQHYQLELPIIKLYQFPTVSASAAFLTGKSRTSPLPNQPLTVTEPQGDVAIIGMAGRFPGASTLDELWELLSQGQETTHFFSDAELDASIPASLKNDPLYVKARGIIDKADWFDSQFFGLNPKVAELMDPQQRIFLEIAVEVLEQTGYLPAQYGGRVGVFAGCGNNTYYPNHVLGHPDQIDAVGPYTVMTVNEKDFMASRTAYQLNLSGPAVSVYSACSTSLLAIVQAVQSLQHGQCEVALAGGASITAPIQSGHLYQEGGMYSPDGHCRPFSADAAGTVFSDGAGVVLLKRLTDAQRDGDRIYAVIKGTGVNNDGGGKGSFTAPSAEGQAGAIRMALADANVDPATISYVETHGTATPLGDPIEFEGLTMAFGEQSRQQYCAIGSIKSNFGHLTAAAGVAGLIKTTLALTHRQLPASLHFSAPNPVIDFTNSPFVVNTSLTDWAPSETTDSGQAPPRRAGISSFGVGGTNVHVILEEWAGSIAESGTGRPMQLLTWSAKTPASSEGYADKLAHYFRQNNTANRADVAFTLQTTRPAYAYRQFAVIADTDPIPLTDHVATTEATPPDDVVFLFPGQGSQFLNMGRSLYEHESVFRQAVDHCADLLATHLDIDLRTILYAETGDIHAERRLKNTRYTQPALFVTEYALAKLWMSWGIEPTILCGHSIGEFVAAHLAGVFSLKDGLRLVAHRGRLVSELPGGSMLSVRLPAHQLTTILPASLSIAASNSRSLCVVAGPDEAIADFARLLDKQQIPNRLLETSHAFHSAMMDPVVDAFREVVAGVPLHRPQKPIASTLTGTWLTDAQATAPQYWARHLRETVRFADALDTIGTLTAPLLLEVGPGQATATLARQQLGRTPVAVLPGLPNQTDGQSTWQAVLTTLGKLWQHGLTPNWATFYAGQQRQRLLLPTYAFDRKRCWVDAMIPVVPQQPVPVATIVPQQLPLSTPLTPMRKDTLMSRVSQLLEEASGIDMTGATPTMNFLEIGLDSLLLTQVALTLKKEFGLPITFRQLTTTYNSPEQLVAYLDSALPPEVNQPVQSTPQPVAFPVPPASQSMTQPSQAPISDTALGLISQQLQLLARQVSLLQGGSPVAVPSPAVALNGHTPSSEPAAPIKQQPELTPEEAVELKKPFGATARIDRQAASLSPAQQTFLKHLTQRYTQKTAGSKQYAQQHRAQMADPRVVSGFKPHTKELVYPIVVNRSKGSRLWDIDGNEYIDALNGFGSNMFGYQPDFIKEALHAQVENGFEVGPQHELAGEVCSLICELTGFDRAALCSTGSEAVLGAMRVARTVTGRSLIVAFTGSYHGIVDEVLVRGTKKLKSYPAASGIMPEAVQNMLILDYGTDESLRIIRERAHELAAVLVEPVQSRRPEFVPIEFLKEVRAITAAAGTVLIFDEVITGFRTHPGGVQALFGIQADIASYGKVVGAGLPIGVIAGKRHFMDALDGGHWQYGDGSVPEVGVTYFAGTFVRHPLALATAKASLSYLKAAGPRLQQTMNANTKRLADALNQVLTQRHLPLYVAQFSSLWKIKSKDDLPYSELLFTLMREKGIHIWDGFPCFLTESHTDADIDTIIYQFTRSIDELLTAGFLPVTSTTQAVPAVTLTPPTASARLGRDRQGNPAWFMPNPDQPGKYLQVELT